MQAQQVLRNDQPTDDKPRRNLATIAQKVLRHVYDYVKVDSKSGELEYMQFQGTKQPEMLHWVYTKQSIINRELNRPHAAHRGCNRVHRSL